MVDIIHQLILLCCIKGIYKTEMLTCVKFCRPEPDEGRWFNESNPSERNGLASAKLSVTITFSFMPLACLSNGFACLCSIAGEIPER